jgi:hypothetical protein
MVENLAKGLAFALLAGRWTEGGMVARGWEALGAGSQGPELTLWLRQVVQWLLQLFPTAPIDRDDELAALLVEAMRGRCSTRRRRRRRTKVSLRAAGPSPRRAGRGTKKSFPLDFPGRAKGWSSAFGSG